MKEQKEEQKNKEQKKERAKRKRPERNLSEDIILQMRNLRRKGWSYYKIGEYFGVSNMTVLYHLNPHVKERIRARSRRAYEKNKNDPSFKIKQREYIRRYMNKRYHEDEEFRKRIINHNIKSFRRKQK